MIPSNLQVGICGASTQSGMAYLADLCVKKFRVCAYARDTEHGKGIIGAIRNGGGIWLQRPPNINEELTQFVPIGSDQLTHELSKLIEFAEILILPVPAHYHLEIIENLVQNGLKERRIPIVLSPSRTCASPYIWKLLGDSYPIVCLATSPYSAKTLAEDRVLIKRRKRTMMGSLEGSFSEDQRNMLQLVFPQAAFCYIPGLTSLSNIGAVFHPTTYIMNLKTIADRKARGEVFSFYMEGIAERADVAKVLEEIDQVRLKIADALGFETFGLSSKPREDVWKILVNGLRALEQEHENEIDVLRKIRRQFVEYISSCVLSAQHWLDITYGVERNAGESLQQAIKRTPTYQSNSYPQFRYLEEDIPTGLVPYEALAKKLGLNCDSISKVINNYNQTFSTDARKSGRNLDEFSIEYLKEYLLNQKRSEIDDTI